MTADPLSRGTRRQIVRDVRVLGRALRQSSLRALLLSWFGWAMARKASRVVLVIVGYDVGGVGAAAAVTVATLLAAALAAPWGGVLGDRWPPARALSVGYALQAVALTATAVVVAVEGRTEVLLALAAAVGASSALTRPVHLAALPAVARHPDELTLGNAASASLDGLASLLGPLVAGLVLVLAGPGWAIGVFALVLGASSVLALRVVVVRDDRSSHHDRMRSEVLAGLRTLVGDPDAASIVGVVTLQYVVVGLLDVLAVVLVVDQFGRDAAAAALLAASVGAGAALGGVASVTVSRHQGLASSTLLGAVIAGVPVAVLGLAPGLSLACGLLVGYGVGKSLVTVAGQILLQRTVPDEVATRVFGVNEGLMQAGTALGAALAPVLLAAAGLTTALAIAGALVPLAAVVALVRLRRLDARAVVPGPTFDLLTSVTFLSLLPLRSLERLARAAGHDSANDGDRIVEQGRPGDDYFVLSRGRAQVLIDGRPVRILETGDGFGEIALLRSSPRTATVDAVGDVDLVILSRTSFLAAVTGTTHAYMTADRLAQGWLDDDLDRVGGSEQQGNAAPATVTPGEGAAIVPGSRPVIGRDLEDTMETPTVADLRRSPLFDGIDDAALEPITDWFEKRAVDTGEVLAREGASGYAFMILGTATAAVTHGEEHVRDLTPGDWFGEGAILGAGRRTATVTATAPGNVWVLFGTRFRELGQRFPEQQALIESVFASRQD